MVTYWEKCNFWGVGGIKRNFGHVKSVCSFPSDGDCRQVPLEHGVLHHVAPSSSYILTVVRVLTRNGSLHTSKLQNRIIFN
jgi:hypothetical protein